MRTVLQLILYQYAAHAVTCVWCACRVLLAHSLSLTNTHSGVSDFCVGTIEICIRRTLSVHAYSRNKRHSIQRVSENLFRTCVELSESEKELEKTLSLLQ